jgi:uncharacterized membrane protein YeiH
MADLSNFLNGGGAYRIKSININTIATGASGTVLNVTASGSDLVYVYQFSSGSLVEENNISVVADSITLASGSDIGAADGSDFNGAFAINSALSISGSRMGGLIQSVVCKNFQIIKDTGITASTLQYKYFILGKI